MTTEMCDKDFQLTEDDFQALTKVRLDKIAELEKELKEL
jgi:hypothetical protein